MKINPINYTQGGMSLEVVGETPVETALLRQIFKHGCMDVGDGNSDSAGGHTGFYLNPEKTSPPVTATQANYAKIPLGQATSNIEHERPASAKVHQYDTSEWAPVGREITLEAATRVLYKHGYAVVPFVKEFSLLNNEETHTVRCKLSFHNTLDALIHEHDKDTSCEYILKRWLTDLGVLVTPELLAKIQE